jgi:hypothetical protein
MAAVGITAAAAAKLNGKQNPDLKVRVLFVYREK